MKLPPSDRNNVIVADLTNSVESSMSKVILARLVSEPTMRKKQLVRNSVCLITRKNNYVGLIGRKEGYCTFAVPKTLESFIIIKSSNFLVNVATFELNPCSFIVLSGRH
ncbi:unnamed protein product [Hymenolepis diminuta]|uniref:Uncharacterized protein n=1 Tax=Hymenolepis diminuta TaxID=6216 RepID=A0A564ZA08_HYMDI|nr:unnamed protein product [Hymenolepis diminuta]